MGLEELANGYITVSDAGHQVVGTIVGAFSVESIIAGGVATGT